MDCLFKFCLSFLSEVFVFPQGLHKFIINLNFLHPAQTHLPHLYTNPHHWQHSNPPTLHLTYYKLKFCPAAVKYFLQGPFTLPYLKNSGNQNKKAAGFFIQRLFFNYELRITNRFKILTINY